MPLLKFSGPNQKRVLIGGRYFYNDRKHQQTDFGDFVSQEFIAANLETIKKFNCVVYEPDADEEKRLRADYEKMLHDSSMNRTAYQRLADLHRIAKAGTVKEINQICEPYKLDVAFMNFAEKRKVVVTERQEEIKKRGEVIKKIFKCNTNIEVDKIARGYTEPEILEAVEARKEEIAHKAIEKIADNILKMENVDEIVELAAKYPNEVEIQSAAEEQIEKLHEKEDNK